MSCRETTIEVMGDSRETPLNVVRLYVMEILPSGALDISRSLHLIISYLLKDKKRRLGVRIPWLDG